MNTLFTIALILVPMALIMASAVVMMKNNIQGKSTGKSMRVNLATFLVLILMVATFSFMASAEEGDVAAEGTQVETQAEEVEVATTTDGNSKGLGLLAAGIVTGLAGIGAGLAIAAGAPAAIAAITEDPKSFGKSIIFVALGESIAIFGVVISILILNKI